MPAPFSAVDSISPAFADARRMLFVPKSFALWCRMAVLGLLTGEFSAGGGSGGFNVPQNNHYLMPPSVINGGIFDSLPALLRGNWPWIVVCALLLVGLFFVAAYLSSVSRFVLLESVITGRCDFRHSWKKWRGKGLEYFTWDVSFTVCCITALFLLIGIPLWTILRKIAASTHPISQLSWGVALSSCSPSESSL
jgi:hypothetical protein